MKYSPIILLTILIWGCTKHTKEAKPNYSEIKTEGTPQTVLDTFDFYSDEVLIQVDAEELCEFSFDFFLPQLNRSLKEDGVVLDVQLTPDYETSFEVTINGIVSKLYTQAELSNGTFWDSGPRTFF